MSLVGLKSNAMVVDLKIISKKDYEDLKKGKAFEISVGFHSSPFGKCLVGVFEDRICHLSFVKGAESVNVKALESQWPGGRVVRRVEATGEAAGKVFGGAGTVKVLLKGTAFEGKVWRAVARIPRGATASYEDVAAMCGHGTAVRAAANAVAKNYVAYAVPCHRVIRKDGSLHKYQWGSSVKKEILEFEKTI